MSTGNPTITDNMALAEPRGGVSMVGAELGDEVDVDADRALAALVTEIDAGHHH